jgi:hypothetical protein
LGSQRPWQTLRALESNCRGCKRSVDRAMVEVHTPEG